MFLDNSNRYKLIPTERVTLDTHLVSGETVRGQSTGEVQSAFVDVPQTSDLDLVTV